MLYRSRGCGAAGGAGAYHRSVNDPAIIDVELTQGPVRQEDAAPGAAAWLSGMGGECVFLGRTRAETHAGYGPLVELEYEAYAPMASALIAEIARDAAREFGCGFIGVRHSVGRVPVGEASVLIRALAPHRNEAFLACRLMIDRLKREAPIWKRERWEGGVTWQEGAPANAQASDSAGRGAR